MTASTPARQAVAPLVRDRYGDDWWRRGVVYQIYPRSFADSDGDGMGDLAGITSHLDHLGPEGLGIDAIWLSPIYPSSGRDGGYDVSDHAAVDPMLGSEADFDELVAEAHARGIRVILDLVMNHTSFEHPWFVASRASRDGPYADWFLWRDPSGVDARGRRRPPNNWRSFFGGPGWTWDPVRGQFYYHTFLAEQPEINWRAPGVEAAQFEMVRGWLDRGVDGFRLDVFNAFLKDPALRSNPRQRGTSPWGRQRHLHDRDQADLAALLVRFRALVDEQPGRMTVGELFDGTVESAAGMTEANHVVFDWELVSAPWSTSGLAAAIDRREAAFGSDRWPTAVLSNHDQERHASRLARSAGTDDVDAVAKAAAVLLLTLRGTPFLYYGEELGMSDVDVPLDESVDPPVHNPDMQDWRDRSRGRTPMPWTGGPGAGFTTGRPWLRLGPDTETRNVAAQAADPDSVLATYRRLLAARTEIPVLTTGALRRLDPSDPGILAYQRTGPDGDALVLIDVGGTGAKVELDRLGPEGAGEWRPVVGSHRDPGERSRDGRSIEFRPFEALVAVPAKP